MRKTEYIKGLKKAMPIALGYFPVSFTFGIMAAGGGIHPGIATLISLTNFTSAGQFAGTNLILHGAVWVEIAVTTFVINIRYMLMSVALTQKLEPMKLGKKLLLAFGVTDETFALATLEQGKISFYRMLGMMSGPYIGWALGTFCGAYACNLLPVRLQSAMGIALYGMFLALIIPPAKKSRAILMVVLTSILISVVLAYLPFLQTLSSGWKIIFTTIVASGYGALFFPRKGEGL